MFSVRNVLSRKKFLSVLSTILLTSTLVACSETETGSNDKENTESTKRNEITIMTTAYSPDPPNDSSPVFQALEDFTDTDITVNWVIDSAYQDKLNITLATGDLPHIMMMPTKLPSFISAVRDGAFWEVGPYLKDYPNLSQANEITLNNSSIGGKVYGIYRARPLGRSGVIFRKDWLQNVGLETPKTIDDFYNTLKAFTENDPDGNGKDDTYGMVISKYAGPFDVMQTWFGAPNKWGVSANGELHPDFTTEEYLNALKFFKKLYDEGLINEDFAVMDPQKWGDPLLNSEAGVIVDVLDRAHRAEDAMLLANPELVEPIDIVGAVEGPKGLFNLPTSGYSGMLAIPTSSVKTEEDLKRVLTFIDKLSEVEAQVLSYNGIEGRHYEMVDGEIKVLTTDNQALINEFTDLNQFQTGIPADLRIKPKQTPLLIKEDQVMIENEDIVVGNPAISYISEVYAQKGQQLDNIINDARIKFIVGQIDEAGLQDAIALWHSSGGDDYIAEINKLHKESK